LDPVLWTAIFLIARGKRLTSLADPVETAATLETLGEWNLYLLLFKVACLVLGHAYLYRSARRHIAAAAQTIAEIGNLDDALRTTASSSALTARSPTWTRTTSSSRAERGRPADPAMSPRADGCERLFIVYRLAANAHAPMARQSPHGTGTARAARAR
jgi:cbb3-type cytochrome oxidase subunit 3